MHLYFLHPWREINSVLESKRRNHCWASKLVTEKPPWVWETNTLPINHLFCSVEGHNLEIVIKICLGSVFLWPMYPSSGGKVQTGKGRDWRGRFYLLMDYMWYLWKFIHDISIPKIRSQIEFWSKGLIWNNGGTNSWSLDRNSIGVAIFNFQNDHVFECHCIIEVGGQCQLNISFRGNDAFTGFNCPKGLFVCLQHKTTVTREDILGLSFCTCQSPLYFKRLALWNSTSKTNIIIFFFKKQLGVCWLFFFFQKTI